MHDLRKRNGVIWRELAGFDDDGIARHQRRSQLAGNQKEREVPGQNPCRHAKRPLEYQDIFAGTIALQNFTFVAARPLGHVIKIIRGESHLNLGQLLSFAAFGND